MKLSSQRLHIDSLAYRIAGMFGGNKVWRISPSKVNGEKKFGELMRIGAASLISFIILDPHTSILRHGDATAWTSTP